MNSSYRTQSKKIYIYIFKNKVKQKMLYIPLHNSAVTAMDLHPLLGMVSKPHSTLDPLAKKGIHAKGKNLVVGWRGANVGGRTGL